MAQTLQPFDVDLFDTFSASLFYHQFQREAVGRKELEGVLRRHSALPYKTLKLVHAARECPPKLFFFLGNRFFDGYNFFG